jgi:hypothetical protein
MERNKKGWVVLILIVAFSFLSIYSTEAADELYLTGILKSVDIISGTVMVDVKSQNCYGFKRFKVDNASELRGLEGKRISFSIDSPACKGGTLYKIISVMSEGGTK